eukprot:scpid10790/ scgid9881/ 
MSVPQGRCSLALPTQPPPAESGMVASTHVLDLFCIGWIPQSLILGQALKVDHCDQIRVASARGLHNSKLYAKRTLMKSAPCEERDTMAEECWCPSADFKKAIVRNLSKQCNNKAS